MSFTYSGDPSKSTLDLIRFKIGDTVDNGHLFEDEELNYELTASSDNIGKALINICRVAIAKTANDCDYKEGPESVKLSQINEQYRLLYRQFKKDYSGGRNAVPYAKISSPIFKIGMHDLA